MHDPWIWLPQKTFPHCQTNRTSAFSPMVAEDYCVAAFLKSYSFPKNICSAELRFSGDTEFALFCNGSILATGPVNVEGDFGGTTCAPSYYATRATVYPEGNTLVFFAQVKRMPVKLCDYSKGHGGFFLTGTVTLEDGQTVSISTDESWECWLDRRFVRPYFYDGTRECSQTVFAEPVPDIWHCTDAPLKIRQENVLTPTPSEPIAVPAHGTCEAVLTFDRIYAGFLYLEASTAGRLRCAVRFSEHGEGGTREDFLFDWDGYYRGFEMHTAGALRITLCNSSDKTAYVTARPGFWNSKTACCFTPHTA